MAGCAGRLGHLTVIDAIAQSNHRLRRAGRDRESSSTYIRVGSLGWFGLGLDDFAGRS